MIRKTLAVGIIFLFIASTVTPAVISYDEPEVEWYKTFGGSSDDVGYSIQQTSDGGYIITGGTESFGAGNSDVWLIKTNDIGDKQWDKTFGGSSDDAGRSIQQTSDGGYIITGFTDSFGAGESDVWLIKTDSNGNKQWDKTFGSSIESDRGSSVQQTSDGGYIITGTAYTYPAGDSDIWLIKTDSNGNLQWDETFGGINHEEGRSVQQTSDGGYIIIGTENYLPYQSGDVWLIKTNSNGNLQWDKTFGDTSFDSGWSVQQTSDNGYIIIGVTGIFSTGDFDIWLIKTDSNGNLQWDKTFGGASVDWGCSVQQTSDDGYIITGFTDSYGAGDAWLIKTDSNGNKQWDKTFGGTNQDWGWSVQETSDDGYILTGSTDSYGAGQNDVWLIKLSENQPPTAPVIDGETDGDVGTEYDYDFTNCIDPDGDDMTYHVEWDDGGVDEGFVASGGGFTLTHSWDAEDDYTIKAKLIDERGAESEWAYLEVTMPVSQHSYSFPLLQRLLERFPNMFPILRNLLEAQ